MDFPHTIGLALPSAPPPAPPLQVAQVALGLLIYIDADSIYNCDAGVTVAAVSPAHACPGGLAHLHRLMSAPGFGMAVPTAGQCMCMATISRLDTMASIYMHSSWPKIGHAAVASAFEPRWESTSALYIWPQSQPWPQARDPPAQHGVRVP